MSFNIVPAYADGLSCRNEELKTLEEEMVQYYPIGDDTFRIDHGRKYLEFFNRMGTPYYKLIYSGNKLVGTGCGVLRVVNNMMLWYICDLKIKTKYRGNMLPFKMMMKSLHLRKITDKCYAISMNIAGAENRIVNLAKHMSRLGMGFNYAGNILIYSLNYEQILRIYEDVEKEKGKFYFVSLKGTKDIILKKTGRMKLLHLNFLKNRRNIFYLDDILPPMDGYTHMICLHERDPLVKKLTSVGIKHDSTASIIEHGLGHLTAEQWDFIQTSEI